MTQRQASGSELRVVFIDHVARLSGGEIALLRLLPALAERVNVHVLLGEDGPLVSRLQELGIAVEVFPIGSRLRDLRKERTGLRHLDPVALAQIPPYVYRLSRRLRQLKPDVVHTNSLKAALYGGTAARLARVPAVWHIRDRIAPDYLPLGAIAFVRAASRVLPVAIIANSRTTLDTLPTVKRMKVIGSAVVPDSVGSRGVRLRVGDLQTTVGVIGRLAPWKGQHIFLEAFAAAFRGTPVQGRIIGSAMFGEDVYAQDLRQHADRLGIAQQVQFRGFREDIWSELAELDILVHCSITPEPFGQVVLEGMAAGVPVIAAAAGGPAELITDGVNGILTPPSDSRALAVNMRKLHDDPALRTRLAAAAQLRSLEFTPERAAVQLFDLYREILSP